MKLGLCCLFAEQPIKYRTTTATACGRLSDVERRQKLSRLCWENAVALQQTIAWCAANGVGAFRVGSQFWPLKTHPTCGYQLDDLPDAAAILDQLGSCRKLAVENEVRLSFHPDQFVVLNSPRPEVVANSIAEFEYQAEAAELIGADVINIHGGGAYGDKGAALVRLRLNLQLLSPRARQRITLENDDKIFTPADLLPVCTDEQIPLCYDVHHHRCLPDALSIDAVTAAGAKTWAGRDSFAPSSRTPLFHLSSPLNGWGNPRPQLHHDYIDPGDIPPQWLKMQITVDIEAKAKELAIQRLQTWLRAQNQPPKPGRLLAPAKRRG